MNVLTVDFRSPDAPKVLDRSLRETGFAVIRNHPLSKDLLDRFYHEWKQFFESPAKFDYLFDPELQSGYFPFRTENAKNYSKKDLKEFFHLFPNTRLPQGMSQTTTTVMRELIELSTCLLTWIHEELPSPLRDSLSIPFPDMIVDSPGTLLRVLHYPPLNIVEDRSEPGAVRAAPHEDINLITLLPAATMPGLQVKNLAGQWHEVPCDPGSIVINSGDMLQMATSGFYPSTTHQVVNPLGQEALHSRYSAPLFLHPRSEVLLQPSLTAGQYLTQRLKEIGLKK